MKREELTPMMLKKMSDLSDRLRRIENYSLRVLSNKLNTDGAVNRSCSTAMHDLDFAITNAGLGDDLYETFRHITLAAVQKRKEELQDEVIQLFTRLLNQSASCTDTPK